MNDLLDFATACSEPLRDTVEVQRETIQHLWTQIGHIKETIKAQEQTIRVQERSIQDILSIFTGTCREIGIRSTRHTDDVFGSRQDE